MIAVGNRCIMQYLLYKNPFATTILFHQSLMYDNEEPKDMELQAHLNDNMHIKFFCIEPDAFIESCALAII